MKSKRFKNDIILVAVLIVIALAVLLPGLLRNSSAGEPMVRISVNGRTHELLPLSEDKVLTVMSENGTNDVIISNGTVWMSDASCPDKLCVYHKHISKSREQIVCLPNKVVVEIVSDEDSEIDSVSH